MASIQKEMPSRGDKGSEPTGVKVVRRALPPESYLPDKASSCGGKQLRKDGLDKRQFAGENVGESQ